MYQLIYADPPWSYNDKGFGKRPDGALSGRFDPAAGRYSTMPLAEITDLPVASIAAPDCALALWATSPLLPEALSVIKAWGFKFKTVLFCWSKITSSGKEVANLGQWTLGNIELCLLGTRGSPQRQVRTIRQLVVDERTEHSKKPDEVRKRLELLFGNVSRIELFARGEIEGWDTWGNETPLRMSYQSMWQRPFYQTGVP